MRLLLVGGRVLDPANGVDGTRDVLVEDGVIREVAPGLGLRVQDAPGLRRVDAAGLWVVPGLVDMHVHLREPGREEDETIRSGTAAAALGGVTTVLSMPNTVPPLDTPERVAWVRGRGRTHGHVRVVVAGAVTTGQAGQQLAPLSGMVAQGAVAFTDDGKPVATGGLLRQCLRCSRDLGTVVIEHCEDPSLSDGGCMNEGPVATQKGIRGYPNVAESALAARDLEILRREGGRLHLAHISTRETVELLRRAKEDGLDVTGEVCPHHFTLSDRDIPGTDANWKMNPPLRSPVDVEALQQAFASGIIDVIATDHAPHAAAKKARGFVDAPFGIIGLETLVPLSLELVRKGLISPLTWARVCSTNPARLLGLRDAGSLTVGHPADLTLVDPLLQRTAGPFASLSQNSPFAGRPLTGHAVMTVVGGRVVMERGALVEAA